MAKNSDTASMGILTLLLSSAGALLMSLLVFACRKSWELRGIQSVTSLPSTVAAVALAGTAMGGVAGLATTSAIVGLSAGIAGALIALIILTDLGSMKIPKEPCWISAGIGLGITLTYPMSGFTRLVIIASSLIAWALLAGVVLVSGGLGMGDVRFVLAVSLLTTWWAGPLTGVVIVFVGSMIQLAARALFSHKKPSWLKIDPEHPKMLPFGPALALGAVFVIAAGTFGVQF
jgi:prepilin signal peptidase PulO-like enzyme (type II secretory pathway)